MKLGYIYGSKVIGDMNLGTDPYTGDPSNLTIPGDLTVEGDFTFGDAVVDTMILNGRMATGSIAGTEIDIDDTYTYGELIEIRTNVSDWAGVGTEFAGLYLRVQTSVDSTGMTIRGSEVWMANADGFDITNMLGTFVGIMGKGNSTITLMRGAELSFTWFDTDTVTDAVGLRIRFAGFSVPTNTIYGVEFAAEGDTAGINAAFQEIQMKTGAITISSSTISPNGVITAPAGSICLVSSGSGVNDRMWVNTNGVTAWTNVVTAA